MRCHSHVIMSHDYDNNDYYYEFFGEITLDLYHHSLHSVPHNNGYGITLFFIAFYQLRLDRHGRLLALLLQLNDVSLSLSLSLSPSLPLFISPLSVCP